MEITLDIPANQTNRVVSAMCQRYGYDPALHGEGTPAKQAFVKAYLIGVMLAAVEADEADTAVADYPSKRQDAINKVRTEITIT
jgi:hypothetical protein